MRPILFLVTGALCCFCIIGQVGFAASPQGEKTAMDYLGEASAHYRDGDFKKAIPLYQKAFDLEKEHPTLSKTFWKVLIDNFGISYGITGELKQAKEIFEYGISKDPAYPLFYYNLACTYGEMKDRDKAIEYLKLAFERKKNIIEGEQMPDPSTDSSFQRFMKDEKFLKALKELN
jgi:tetratricopeptide (TPR) repeat protein